MKHAVLYSKKGISTAMESIYPIKMGVIGIATYCEVYFFFSLAKRSYQAMLEVGHLAVMIDRYDFVNFEIMSLIAWDDSLQIFIHGKVHGACHCVIITSRSRSIM